VGSNPAGQADAVISADSKAHAWRRVAQLAAHDAEGHPTSERLALDEIPDPVYSMMIGFAIAHDLLADDAKKLAQRLYHGQREGDQQAKG
jgi:hypothetical protein